MEAQLVERSTENRKVGGSSPLRGTYLFHALCVEMRHSTFHIPEVFK